MNEAISRPQVFRPFNLYPSGEGLSESFFLGRFGIQKKKLMSYTPSGDASSSLRERNRLNPTVCRALHQRSMSRGAASRTTRARTVEARSVQLQMVPARRGVSSKEESESESDEWVTDEEAEEEEEKPYKKVMCCYCCTPHVIVMLFILFATLAAWGCTPTWSKCPPWQRPSSSPAAPQFVPGGSGRPGTPRVRPSHWDPSHGPRCSSWPPPVANSTAFDQPGAVYFGIIQQNESPRRRRPVSWSIWPPKKPGDAAQAFFVFDRDGDGFVGLEDLEFAVKLSKARLTRAVMSRGLRTVRTGPAHRPPACCACRRRRAACPPGTHVWGTCKPRACRTYRAPWRPQVQGREAVQRQPAQVHRAGGPRRRRHARRA